jgi:hypothetical protein
MCFFHKVYPASRDPYAIDYVELKVVQHRQSKIENQENVHFFFYSDIRNANMSAKLISNDRKKKIKLTKHK